MRTPGRATGSVCAALLVMGVVAVAASPASAIPPGGIGLSTTGALAFGENFIGQLGDGTQFPHDTPVEPAGLHTGVRQVSAGGGHTLALRDTGTVDAWGGNHQGQLGDGTTEARFAPHRVAELVNIRQVSAGMLHNLAVDAAGRVWAWGNNSNGELGDGTQTDRRTPVQVPGLSGVVQVAAGEGYSLAVRGDGRVMAWGENDRGQLGDGTRADRTAPVPVFGLTSVVQVAAGRRHSLAVRSDGGAWSWGSNGNGALGDGTFVDHVIPVQVPLLNHVTQVAAGRFASVFLLNGGVVQWGAEIFCNFGDGGPVNGDPPPCPDPRESATFLPVEIRGEVRQISADNDTGAAVLSDGTLWQWLADPRAEASTPDRVDPVRVNGVTNAVQVDVGHSHTALVVDRPLVNAP